MACEGEKESDAKSRELGDGRAHRSNDGSPLQGAFQDNDEARRDVAEEEEDPATRNGLAQSSVLGVEADRSPNVDPVEVALVIGNPHCKVAISTVEDRSTLPSRDHTLARDIVRRARSSPEC